MSAPRLLQWSKLAHAPLQCTYVSKKELLDQHAAKMRAANSRFVNIRASAIQAWARRKSDGLVGTAKERQTK